MRTYVRQSNPYGVMNGRFVKINYVVQEVQGETNGSNAYIRVKLGTNPKYVNNKIDAAAARLYFVLYNTIDTFELKKH